MSLLTDVQSSPAGNVLNTLTGGVLNLTASLAQSIGIKSATPKLDWNTRNGIAVPIMEKWMATFTAAGYAKDKTLLEDARKLALQFVSSTNPGAGAGARASSIKAIIGETWLGGVIWQSLMYSYEGAAKDPSVPWGIPQRTQDFLDRVLVPATKLYESRNNLAPSVSASSFAGGTQPAATEPAKAGSASASLPWLILAAVIVAVAWLWGNK